MTRAEPTTIRVRLSIEIRFDIPTAAILWKEDRVGCQHDWIRIVFVVIDNEANDKDAAAGATWMNSYRLRHRRQIELQRRRRRRNMNEFVSSSSLTTNRTTKTPPRTQQWLDPIGFVVINDEANAKDSAAGVVAATGGSRRTGWRCRLNVPCAMYQGTTTDDAIYVIAGATRTLNDDIECTKNHEKHENHERAIWLLCNGCTKGQYDCYPINTLK